MEITPRNAKTFSRMGIRAVYGQTIYNEVQTQKKLIAVSADLGRSSGLERLYKEFPEHFLNTGICEQNMVAVSAGLARLGFNVFASTFAPFASMRAAEQVRMNMGYMQEPVKLVALGSGVAMGFLGNSHFGLEDLSVMQSVPNLTVVAPADCVELVKLIQALRTYEKPTYIRLTGSVNTPIVYEDDYQFQIGKAIWLVPPADINVVAHGAVTGNCLLAVRKLKEVGYSVGLLNMHTIKPIDSNAISQLSSISKKIVVVEEHFEHGGLSNTLLNLLYNKYSFRGEFLTRNLGHNFLGSGEYNYIMQNQGLDPCSIEAFLTELAS